MILKQIILEMRIIIRNKIHKNNSKKIKLISKMKKLKCSKLKQKKNEIINKIINIF